MDVPCQKCGRMMQVVLQGRGGIFRCPHCSLLNAFLRHEADGTIYFGDFKIIREAGQGANAIVTKVRHVPTGNIRALKLFCAEALQDAHARKEYARESQLAKEMVHPNIIRVHDAAVLDNIYYVVMEFVTGLNMYQLLQDSGPVDQFDAMRIAIHVLDALEYVWSNFLMIHRDIKPQNIILDKAGIVKVCDFGMVTDHETAAVDLDVVEGTPYYISPEAIQEGAYLDNRSDIYCLGATLFHMISGIPPFNYTSLNEVINARLREPAPNLRNVFAEVHPEISLIIQTMMAPDPDDRYVTAAECRADMKLVMQGISPSLLNKTRENQGK